VAGLAAVVAAAVGTAVQAEGWAVGLDVAETLAVIALLGWKRSAWLSREGSMAMWIFLTLGSARKRASAGLVSCFEINKSWRRDGYRRRTYRAAYL
jgi:hypothetical protein